MPSKPTLTALAALVGGVLLLSACGNKGSLILPPKPADSQDKPAAKPADNNSATPANRQ